MATDQAKTGSPCIRRPASVNPAKRLGSATIVVAGLWILLAAATAAAQTAYKQPPKEILDVLHAPTTPQASVSPAHDYMLLVQAVRYPPISVLAEPMLRLAGVRINPNTDGRHLVSFDVGITIKKIKDGSGQPITFPAGL